jgi:hypothetical protein
MVAFLSGNKNALLWAKRAPAVSIPRTKRLRSGAKTKQATGCGGNCAAGLVAGEIRRARYRLRQSALPYLSLVQTLFEILDNGGPQSVPMFWRVAG